MTDIHPDVHEPLERLTHISKQLMPLDIDDRSPEAVAIAADWIGTWNNFEKQLGLVYNWDQSAYPDLLIEAVRLIDAIHYKMRVPLTELYELHIKQQREQA